MGQSQGGARGREGWPRRPVFVVGPPRSGTTLARVALSRHPDVSITTETHLLDQWIERHPGIRDGDREAFDAFWSAFTSARPFRWHGLPAEDIEGWLRRWDRYDAAAVMAAILAATAERDAADRPGEKTPGHALHVAELLEAFPEATIVYTLRDPRGCVASELRHDADWTAEVPEAAAARWARTARPLTAWRHDARVHVLRYEDVVVDPAGTLASACRSLEVPADRDTVGRLLDDQGGHPDYQHGDLDPWGPVEAASLGAWRRHLGPTALEAVDHHCGELAATLGYPPPTAELDAAGRVRAAAARARRHARRVVHRLRRAAGASS